MSLNHTLSLSAFSNPTGLGGRLENATYANLNGNGLSLAVPAAAKTAAYTVTASDFLVPVNTSGGAVTVTLPAAAATPAPSQGQVFLVLDSGNDAGTNNITISAGIGTTLVGLAGAGTINTNRSCQRFIYYGTTYYQW